MAFRSGLSFQNFGFIFFIHSLLDLLRCVELLSYCMTHLHFNFNWWMDGLNLLLGLSNIKQNFCFLRGWQVLRHQIIFKPCCCIMFSLLDSYYGTRTVCLVSARQTDIHVVQKVSLWAYLPKPLKILSHKTPGIWKSIWMFLPMWK